MLFFICNSDILSHYSGFPFAMKFKFQMTQNNEANLKHLWRWEKACLLNKKQLIAHGLEASAWTPNTTFVCILPCQNKIHSELDFEKFCLNTPSY